MTIAFFTSTGLVVPSSGNILLAFLIPGIFILLFAAICWKFGESNSESEGLDSLRTMYGEAGESNVASEEEKSSLSYWQLIWKYVFCNPSLLLVAVVNVALYFVRFGIED